MRMVQCCAMHSDRAQFGPADPQAADDAFQRKCDPRAV